MNSDRELIDRYEGGDEEAFREFYSRHRRPLYVLLLSYVRSRETAEELLQETFLAFLRSLSKLDGTENLRPYLARTARNLAIDWLRRERCGERALQARAADPLFQKVAESPTERNEDAERMSALLYDLPTEQREAVVLHGLVGLTFREVAELAAVPEATVVSRYRYGIEKLRAAFARGGCK